MVSRNDFFPLNFRLNYDQTIDDFCKICMHCSDTFIKNFAGFIYICIEKRNLVLMHLNQKQPFLSCTAQYHDDGRRILSFGIQNSIHVQLLVKSSRLSCQYHNSCCCLTLPFQQHLSTVTIKVHPRETTFNFNSRLCFWYGLVFLGALVSEIK